jgi:hypothetical protein
MWGVSILLTLAAAIVMAWLVNRSPMTVCELEVPASSGEHKFRAVQVVVRPWEGLHNVYGIFMIPEQFKHDRLYTTTLQIQGLTAGLPAGSAEGEDRDNFVVEQGHYFKRAYVPTRTALWTLLIGRFGDLRASCHWWLVFADRAQ